MNMIWQGRRMERLPNTLTVIRILLTFLFLFFIFKTGIFFKILATIVFLVASFTDFFDGYLAKKHNVHSNFGKLMDPIADKFLVLSAFFVFVQLHLIAIWMFVLILFREVVVTFLRFLGMANGKVMPAEKAGKYKTVSQMAVIWFILLFLILRESSLFYQWTHPFFLNWQAGIYVLMLFVVTVTLGSGLTYLWHNRRFVYVSSPD